MAQQARAIRTRRAILESAAAVFAERGYERTTIGEILVRAGVTKGALYFHFASKEDLALGVLDAQMLDEPLTPQPVKLQELVDQGFLLAHRLQRDALVRASVALALDSGATGVDRAAPFKAWIDQVSEVLTVAKARGELLVHVDVTDTAELFSGAFAGIQTMSQILCDRKDLTHRVLVLLRHVLPTICTPALLTTLEMTEERARRLAAEYDLQRLKRGEGNLADTSG
ncbi:MULTISPECIES: ScbR family autoregulator-binding transcription factor [unclassified Streptomyces]|uniref:ScbR family autoregulator-binding transcription factor n=1 Tax=unclassified Streptomyces TaxID=2593676 RepID=UPI00093CE9F2|nr:MULTISPECIES: ScbR family autoregulator-binding transcription factor [unclassified Streptomyces]MBP2585563.1 AcrR family transcriptional regulator [Streptomyces sp. PvR006]MCB8907465.1 TetR/AcrR family transcriptional regulator [Streptomyces sp. CB02980]MCD2463613.1 TetR/AcrR family transcriptional regulator [Streptomyces sp. MBT42]MCX5229469.1 ScbR family autoregulator-binding transcription factor [Streptomyces sp. NBC_00233]OKJ62180.1 gamma-butyrolactone-binding protein [Streptomyces sp. 